MITYLNFKKNDHTIEADYCREHHIDDLGHVVFDIATNKVTEFIPSKEEAGHVRQYGKSKAKYVFGSIIESGKIPEGESIHTFGINSPSIRRMNEN